MAQQLQPQHPMMIGADPQPIFGGNLIREVPPLYTTAPPKQKRDDQNTGVKVKIAFYMTVLFVIFSLQGTYRFVNTIYHSFTSQPVEMIHESGAPTMKGIILFSGIFFFIALMMLLRML